MLDFSVVLFLMLLLSTLIAVLRHLQKLNVLDAFVTEAPVSPLAIAKTQGKLKSKVYKSKRETYDNEEKKEAEW